MEEEGLVVEEQGSTVLIRTQRSSSCDSCSSKKSCASIGETGDMLVEAENFVGVHVGDRVVYSVGTASLIKAGLLLYLVPVIGFIAGVVLGRPLQETYLTSYNADLVSGVLGVAFLAVAFLGLKLFGNFASKSPSYRPHVLKKV
jgi:sigma-E factor negative regulatory protein RseC